MLNIRPFKVILLSLIIVIAIYYMELNKRKFKGIEKNKGFIIASLAVSLFVIGLVRYPEECYQAAVSGVDTWLNIILPALLPFFIGAELLIGLGMIDFIGTMLEPVMQPLFKTPGHSAFVFIMSIASGYPVGVKLTCNFRKERMCTRSEGQRMLAFCSTSGPLFMIGAVAIGMLGNRLAGTIIAISHYLSAVVLGIIVGFISKDRYKTKPIPPTAGICIKTALRAMLKRRKSDGRPLGVLWGDAVKESINTLLIVGGFVIMFSVIIQLFYTTGAFHFFTGPLERLLSKTPLPLSIIQPVFSGILEMTIGSRQISEIEALPFVYAVCAISLIIGWSGFSIHAQALSFISRTDLNPALYVLSKLFHGLICCAVSYTICAVFLSGKYHDVFQGDLYVLPSLTFLQRLWASIGAFFTILFAMLIIPLLNVFWKPLKHLIIKGKNPF